MNFLRRRSRETSFAWGITLGAAAALYIAWRVARGAVREDDGVELDPETVRTIAAGALLADPALRGYGLSVRSIAPGILDISGTVDTDEAAASALETVRRGPGVRTVLNRIDVSGNSAGARASVADG